MLLAAALFCRFHIQADFVLPVALGYVAC